MQNSRNNRYRLSFSTGGLFLQESLILCQEFFVQESWEGVKREVFARNLLQSKRRTSSQRSVQEIIERMKRLDARELEFFLEGSEDERKSLLWLAICRHYRLIQEFAIEVVREHYLSFRHDLVYEDFDYFLHRKSELNPELEELTESTRSKLRQVLFRILREAGLISSSNVIQRPFLSPRFVDLIRESDLSELRFFPLLDRDIERVN